MRKMKLKVRFFLLSAFFVIILLVTGVMTTASDLFPAFRDKSRNAIDTIACTPLPKDRITETDGARAKGRVFHVDPIRGRTDGNGSAARPWRSLQSLVDRGLIGETRVRATRLDRILVKIPGGWLIPRRYANSRAVVRGGDTLLLHSGNYGAIVLNGLGNRRFLTIAAAPGAHPVLTSLRLDGASHFHIRDFAVTAYGPFKLVAAQLLAGIVPPDNIVLDRLEVGAPVKVGAVVPAQWVKNGPIGAVLTGHCLAMRHSVIHDVRNGALLLNATRTQLTDTIIRDYSLDGVDFSGHDLIIAGNTILDHWDPGDRTHPDCMQGQSGSDRIRYGPVLIENNLCLARTKHRADTGPVLQGINIFDGRWRDVTVRCNQVLVTAGHGIAMYGIDRARVERNTVIGLAPEWPSWIVSFPAKNGRQPTENIIRNNLASGYLNASLGGQAAPADVINSLNVQHDPHIVTAIAKGIDGVKLIRNDLLLRAGGMPHQPADVRLRTIRGSWVPQATPPARFRALFPLPASCTNAATMVRSPAR